MLCFACCSLQHFLYEIAANLQLGVAVRGSGAPIHHHESAVSAMFYGTKQWFVTPPASQYLSRKQIRRWAREARRAQ